MATATITSNGQITIPKEVRDAMGIEAGDRVELVAVERGVYKMLIATKDIRHLRGLVPKPAKPISVEGMNRAVARAPSRR